MSRIRKSIEMTDERTNANIKRWAQYMDIESSAGSNNDSSKPDLSREEQQTRVCKALMQTPMWKNLPKEIMLLLSGFSAGFIQTCRGCQEERFTDSGKWSTFYCASCASIEDRLEELEHEHFREIYYDDEGHIIPHCWYHSESDYCESSTERAGW